MKRFPDPFYVTPLKPVPYNGQPVRWWQWKMDGHRLEIVCGPQLCGVPPCVRALRADGTNIWPSLCNANFTDALRGLPPETQLSAELCVRGEKASSVSTHLASRSKHLELYVFGIPWWNGVDQGGLTMRDVSRQAEEAGLSFAPWGDIATGLPWGDIATGLTDRTADSLLRDTMRGAEGHVEGLVLKDRHYAGWYKLKPLRHIHAIITDVVPGRGKHVGRMGALAIAVVNGDGEKVNIGRVGTGFSDLNRRQITTRSIGQVVTVAYQYVGNNGGLRHPRFVGWAEDNVHPTLDQDEELAAYWTHI